LSDLRDLAREYEARRFPPRRRLDLQAEGPNTARERTLRWIQSYAHEEPGQELLLILERGGRPRRPPGPLQGEVERVLRELEGRLIAWWQPFAEGSIALRLAHDPRLTLPDEGERVPVEGEGRTPETAGAAVLAAHHDIPDELMELATRVAERRRQRDGLSVGLIDVVLRRIWIEVQALAMTERMDFGAALERVAAADEAAAREDDDERW
jgi:hypothetical protein